MCDYHFASLAIYACHSLLLVRSLGNYNHDRFERRTIEYSIDTEEFCEKYESRRRSKSYQFAQAVVMFQAQIPVPITVAHDSRSQIAGSQYKGILACDSRIIYKGDLIKLSVYCLRIQALTTEHPMILMSRLLSSLCDRQILDFIIGRITPE